MARIPAVPEPAPVGPPSAQLRRSRPRFATSAIRRLRTLAWEQGFRRYGCREGRLEVRPHKKVGPGQPRQPRSELQRGPRPPHAEAIRWVSALTRQHRRLECARIDLAQWASGSVVAIASKAAGVMEMRIMRKIELRRRQLAKTGRGHMLQPARSAAPCEDHRSGRAALR